MSEMTQVGITSYGSYVPRLRLNRRAILDANAWANGALRAYGKGERAMCNWDEDSVTMAVEASRNSLAGRRKDVLQGVCLASTSLPFQDRQNAGILANALLLPPEVLSVDITSSQKAGTSGLVAALDMAAARPGAEVLYTASDKRRSKPGSAQELLYGDGAAALTLGSRDVIARYVGAASRTVDFVDHFRGENREYDYTWEERWIRDEGYAKIVPATLQALFQKTGVKAADVRFFAMPCVFAAVPGTIAKAVGLPPESVRDTLFETCGETGTAHPLLMLIGALEEASPGDKILVVGYGQGCDALLFEATAKLATHAGRGGVRDALAKRREERNYNKFLTFNQQIDKDFGIRAEVDIPTPLSALYRKKDMVLGLLGGRCTACGTPQFPRGDVCVNPACRHTGTQEDYPFSDRPARIKTWTADYLTFSLDPPGHYGMVEFEGGGRFMADFADVEPGKVEVGTPVTMAFRIKSFDERRGFRRYFWKAVPAAG